MLIANFGTVKYLITFEMNLKKMNREIKLNEFFLLNFKYYLAVIILKIQFKTSFLNIEGKMEQTAAFYRSFNNIWNCTPDRNEHRCDKCSSNIYEDLGKRNCL